MRRLVGQFSRFGVIGLAGYVIDVGIFNLLLGVTGPIWAKVVSTSVAIVFSWLGNRYWTFREHRGEQLLREGLQFAVVSIGGLLIGIACLAVSHYALGFTSRLADNISSNGVGLVLGTAFRFTLYRLWVFRPRRGEREPLFEEEAHRPAP